MPRYKHLKVRWGYVAGYALVTAAGVLGVVLILSACSSPAPSPKARATASASLSMTEKLMDWSYGPGGNDFRVVEGSLSQLESDVHTEYAKGVAEDGKELTGESITAEKNEPPVDAKDYGAGMVWAHTAGDQARRGDTADATGSADHAQAAFARVTSQFALYDGSGGQ